MATNRRKVGALIFPGFELLDLFGPLEMLGMLPDYYDLHLVAQTSGPVQSNQQVSAYATSDLTDEPDFDILFVPGGAGTRLGVSDTVLLEWIMRASDVAEFTVSVCTGSALLAKAGVLDGRRATTNKLAFDWVMQQGPKVNWIRRARWVQDDQFVTSSGVSAGTDMSLALIELMHGRELAEKVAHWAEYTWNSDPQHDPFA
ncbi:DJ-1/PfpI family protein [uncultured Pelagimonas sp.]|uniref:DJ-1/PfpI family protein n=1 Tax=uncultured Pelagimonas sp. TaxID=1618102 RepID=UPI002629D83D|nr:DJ-1/PfpI family protein [uncultured Pelagimonas sp.]